MSQTYERHGRVWVEETRDTFVVHADYGQQRGRRKARRLMPDDEFYAPDDAGTEQRWSVFARYRDRIEAQVVGLLGTGKAFDLDDHVEVDAQLEDIDQSDPIVGQWLYQRTPEFRREDLQDLIDALQAYKRTRRV